MNKDELNKQIDFELKVKDHLWNALIISVAGTLTFISNPDNLNKKILIIAGIAIIVVLFNAYFKRDDRIQKFIKQLGDKKDE